MATTSAAFRGGGTTFTGTHTVGSKVYARSTSGSDTPVAVATFGDNTSNVMAQGAILIYGQAEGLSTIAHNTLVLATTRDEAATAWTGSAQVYSNDGTAATGAIHVHTNPTDGDTLVFGLTGTTQTMTFKNTVASPGHVKIGATVSATADNIASFINDAATGDTTVPVDGTDWNVAAADTYLSATVSGSNVTLTDRINCARALGWSITPTDPSELVVTEMAGGVDGTLIATIPNTDWGASTSSGGVILSSPDLTTVTLPPQLEQPTQSVPTRGPFAVHIRLGSTPNNTVSLKIQLSNDGSNWFDATTTITDLNTDQNQIITGDDLFSEYARLYFTSHDDATNSVEADIVFVY